MARPATASDGFARLKDLVARLRAPDGCPWDRAQTHDSLQDALIEEAWEAVAAMRQGDPAALAEELGDLLLHVLMHAQIAAEDERFDIDSVVDGVAQKLVRRHPHVFGAERAASPDEVVQTWERVKRAERGGGAKADELAHLPALLAAAKHQERTAQSAEAAGAPALEGFIKPGEAPEAAVGALL